MGIMKFYQENKNAIWVTVIGSVFAALIQPVITNFSSVWTWVIDAAAATHSWIVSVNPVPNYTFLVNGLGFVLAVIVIEGYRKRSRKDHQLIDMLQETARKRALLDNQSRLPAPTEPSVAQFKCFVEKGVEWLWYWEIFGEGTDPRGIEPACAKCHMPLENSAPFVNKKNLVTAYECRNCGHKVRIHEPEEQLRTYIQQKIIQQSRSGEWNQWVTDYKSKAKEAQELNFF